jgi:hypothetical protein
MTDRFLMRQAKETDRLMNAEKGKIRMDFPL